MLCWRRQHPLLFSVRCCLRVEPCLRQSMLRLLILLFCRSEQNIHLIAALQAARAEAARAEAAAAAAAERGGNQGSAYIGRTTVRSAQAAAEAAEAAAAARAAGLDYSCRADTRTRDRDRERERRRRRCEFPAMLCCRM